MLTNYIHVLTAFLPETMRAMPASPESSASTLPRKRGKDSAKAPADAPAVGIEGDWRYIERDELGYTCKNRMMPVKTFDMGRKVHSCCLLLLCSPVISPACVAESTFAAEQAESCWSHRSRPRPSRCFLTGKARPWADLAISALFVHKGRFS